MQTKSMSKTKVIDHTDHLDQKEINFEKKVDINILLNRVKSEKKDHIRKNFLITAGALGSLAITGLIVLI